MHSKKIYSANRKSPTMTTLGASLQPDGRCIFRVWALNATTIELHLLKSDAYIAMNRDEKGYFTCTVEGISAGDKYLYRIDGEKERPDPASQHQPDGVHGASAVVNHHTFQWSDSDFTPVNLQNTVMYQLHVGTYSHTGTFAGIATDLPRLQELGINCIQLLPIAEFPGTRNWGYDGVNLYAAHHAYGGVDGLKHLVNEAHKHGIAVMVDLVYNHLGPEGNYLWDYAPYFTDKYRGGWGDVPNFDGTHSEEVERYFIENAIYWLDKCHIDGMRLDATHGYFDFAAVPFLRTLVREVQEWAAVHNRRVHIIAENDASDRKAVLPREINGVGLDGQWLDDFHHTIHTHLTGENKGYYADFDDFKYLIKCLREGFVRSGDYSVSRGRRVGTYSGDIPADRFVIATQNHDQIGNRMLGERLHHLTDFDSTKLVAGLLFTAPYVPMVFMGEEYADPAPFLFFTSYSDEHLIEAVRAGRKEEFSYFEWEQDPPDPNEEATFLKCKLSQNLRNEAHHAKLYQLYKDLIALRKNEPALRYPQRHGTKIIADEAQETFWVIRSYDATTFAAAFNFNLQEPATLSVPDGNWRKVLASNDAAYSTSEHDYNYPDLLVTDDTIELAPKHFVIYKNSNS